jgi:hypothetical protein
VIGVRIRVSVGIKSRVWKRERFIGIYPVTSVFLQSRDGGEPIGDSESACSCTDSGRGTANDVDGWGFFMTSRAASQSDVRETQCTLSNQNLTIYL